MSFTNRSADQDYLVLRRSPKSRRNPGLTTTSRDDAPQPSGPKMGYPTRSAKHANAAVHSHHPRIQRSITDDGPTVGHAYARRWSGVRQRRINSAGSRGVRLDLSCRSSRSRVSSITAPPNSPFLLPITSIGDENSPQGIQLFQKTVPVFPALSPGTVSIPHSMEGSHPISPLPPPPPPGPPNTPLPTTPRSASLGKHVTAVAQSISSNDRIQKILHEKHMQSVLVGQGSTSDSSDPPSSSSLVETPMQLYGVRPRRQRKDSRTAPPETWPPLRRAMNARRRRVMPKSSPLMKEPVGKGSEIWQQSIYLPGRIQVQASFEHYMISNMTAMDVLCQEDVATDEQIMDELVEFFKSYGFAPVVSELDKFWLKNTEPSRSASVASELDSMPASPLSGPPFGRGQAPPMSTSLLVWGDSGLWIQPSGSMAGSLPVANHSMESLQSLQSLQSDGFNFGRYPASQTSKYSVKEDAVSMRSVPSPSNTTSYFDGSRISDVPSETSTDLLIFGPQCAGSTESQLRYARLATASAATSLSPHWQAHGARSSSPQLAQHRRLPGQKTPSPKAQSPRQSGKIGLRKMFANRGAVV